MTQIDFAETAQSNIQTLQHLKLSDTTMASALVEQIRKLDDQSNKLRDQARQEVLARAEEALTDLNSLGFHYSIAVGKVSRASARHKSDDPCPICKFKTSPPHDGRRHRSQGDKKKPYTAQELVAFGFARI